MAPGRPLSEKASGTCRTLLAAAAALAMTIVATMLALTAGAHVLALVDDLLRENVQRLDLLGRQGRQNAIGHPDCAAQRFSASASPSGVMRTV